MGFGVGLRGADLGVSSGWIKLQPEGRASVWACGALSLDASSLLCFTLRDGR